MSAAAASVPQQADISGSIRPISTQHKLASTTSRSTDAKNGESSSAENTTNIPETRENETAQHRIPDEPPRAELYANINDAQNTFRDRAKEQGVEIKEPDLDPMDEDSAESESDDEETKAEDERNRKRLMDEGAQNQKYQDRGVKPPPDEFLRLYTGVYPTVRNWWTQGQDQEQLERMKKTNNRLRDLNKAAGRDENEYLFPHKKISEFVSGARIVLDRTRGMQNGPQRDEEAKKMLSGYLIFSGELEQNGIDLKMLIPKHIRKELDEIFSMPELEKQRKELNDVLRRPTVKQRAILEPALKLLSDFYDCFGDGNRDGVTKIHAELCAINKRLEESNLNEGLKQDDHKLPVNHLQDILNTIDLGNMEQSQEEIDQVIRDSSKRVEASLEICGVGNASIPEKFTNGEPLPEEELRRMQQDVSDFEGHALHETTGSSVSTGGNQQKERAVKQHQGYKRAGNSTLKLMSLPETKPLISPGINDGITDCGRVLSVARAGFGYRVFTNIGTDAVPVYKMFTGSSFAKSARTFLYQNFSSKPQPPQMEDNHIEIIDTIVHPVKNGNYTWVVYKWTAESDPQPRIMTHTDLARRIGRDPARRQEKYGLDARGKRLEILKLMKASPNEVVAEGVPSFNECPAYMADGLDDS